MTVTADEGPRPDTSLSALAALAPAFKKDGTVTAGNSSPMNDGAAALLLSTETGLERHGLVPMARLVASAAAGVHPDYMGIGPVPASRKALDRAGLGADDLDLVEVNEAFASQAVASIRALGLDPAGSTSTGERSPWVIRSEPPEPGSWRRSFMNWARRVAVTDSPPCA